MLRLKNQMRLGLSAILVSFCIAIPAEAEVAIEGQQWRRDLYPPDGIMDRVAKYFKAPPTGGSAHWFVKNGGRSSVTLSVRAQNVVPQNCLGERRLRRATWPSLATFEWGVSEKALLGSGQHETQSVAAGPRYALHCLPLVVFRRSTELPIARGDRRSLL
jgi:hypothetical protein